jgi:co-chaperonin GroES (HSP10)
MKGQITFNRILVFPHYAKPTKTKAGIILPEGLDDEVMKKQQLFDEHPFQGEVIQVGPQCTICEPGDIVYVQNQRGEPLIENKTYYLLLYESDVMYVIKAEDKGMVKEEV